MDKFIENLKMRETCGFQTRVRIFDEDDKLETETHNITILPGRVSVLESAFGATPLAEHHLTLNSIIQEQRGAINPTAGSGPQQSDDTLTKADLLSREVRYFGIGTGGLNSLSPLTLSEPRSYETRLYNMVPFRCVPVDNDLTDEEKALYRLRRRETINNVDYYTYYLKVFNPKQVNLITSNKVSYSPSYLDSEPVVVDAQNPHPLADVTVVAFVDFEVLVDSNEFKEYYRAANNGTLQDAKLTEFCIVNANEKLCRDVEGVEYQEVYNAELFSKVVHEPAYMNREKNKKRISYQVLS